MRRSFDGLMAIIRDTYQMNPYENAVYLFCGKRKNTLKALYFDKDGFCLLSKRLDSNGRFQWPRNSSEVRQLTRQEFRWLMEGLSVDQPKAIRPVPKTAKKVFWIVQYGENKFFVDNRFFVIFRLFYRLSTAIPWKQKLFADNKSIQSIAVDNSIENLS